jgi:precorrin-3B methylase
MIPVKGHPNLYRDENTGAIINCDNIAYNQYVNSINNRDSQKREIEQMRQDIDEIKSLLKELIHGTK